MNKEQLEKKASEYIDELADREIDYTQIDYEENSYEAGRNRALMRYGEDIFKDGAKWRINSVWHDAKEKPEDDRLYLAEHSNGNYCVFLTNIDFEIMAKSYAFTRWAYIDDLLPEKKGGEQ